MATSAFSSVVREARAPAARRAIGVFVLVQHGSHAAHHEYKVLCELLEQSIRGVFSERGGSSSLTDNAAASTSAPSGWVSGSASVAASPQRRPVQLPPRREFVDEDLIVRVWGTNVNDRLQSDAGTRECAERLVHELVPELRRFASDCHRRQVEVTGTAIPVEPAAMLFSCLGHSFGGVILRDAIALLRRDVYWTSEATQPPHYTRSPFASDADSHHAIFRPVTFASIASPHCGATDMNSILYWGGRLIGAVYSKTYRELLLSSSERMMVDTLVDDEHLDALGSFQRRLLVGSTRYDHIVGFETSTLMFEGLSEGQKALIPRTGNVALRPFEVPAWRCAPATSTTTTPVAAAAPFPTDRKDKAIAAALRARLNFTVLPVQPMHMCIAHDCVALKTKLFPASNMYDAAAKYAAVLADDAWRAASDLTVTDYTLR